MRQITKPAWMISNRQFLTNKTDRDQLDHVELHTDKKGQVWLAVYPEHEFIGHTLIENWEHIYDIRSRIAKCSGVFFPSSAHDYWMGALGDVIDKQKRTKQLTHENYHKIMVNLITIAWPEFDGESNEPCGMYNHIIDFDTEQQQSTAT